MKYLRFILPGLVIAAAAGLLCYQAFITKDLEAGNIFRCVLIILGACLTMLRGGSPRSYAAKKKLYQSAFPDFIQHTFEDDPKKERIFYNAVDDFNSKRYSQGLHRLTALRKDCTKSTDLYAVSVFSGLCYSRLNACQQAVEQYQYALSIRPNSTVASNIGYCYQAMGKNAEAIASYQQAIRIDSTNPNPYNNLSALYFQTGDYEAALDWAQQALKVNPSMPTALSTAAICCALLSDEDGYARYYRQAVASGYNGQTIKDAIQQLDPRL